MHILLRKPITELFRTQKFTNVNELLYRKDIPEDSLYAKCNDMILVPE